MQQLQESLAAAVAEANIASSILTDLHQQHISMASCIDSGLQRSVQGKAVPFRKSAERLEAAMLACGVKAVPKTVPKVRAPLELIFGIALYLATAGATTHM
jgi:hypothetical protein